MLERLLYDGLAGARCSIYGELSVHRENASCTSCINTIVSGWRPESPLYPTHRRVKGVIPLFGFYTLYGYEASRLISTQ